MTPSKRAETILILMVLAMFMGAAIADIFRPLPLITVAKHHPHTVTWADPGVSP